MTDPYREICRTEDVPPGRCLPFMIEDMPVLLCHTEGSFHAVKNLCTHADARLDYGKVQGGTITCPMHHARYDLRTGQAVQSFLKPLQVFPLRIEGNRILVDIG